MFDKRKKLYKFAASIITYSSLLAHGVTGNTSDFGSEESRFEP